MAITLRATKGSKLTHAELDANFTSFQESSGSSLVGFIQSGTGAVATTVQARLRTSVNLFDFMSAAEIADVQAFTYLVDVSAAVNAAFAAHDCIDCPKGGYRIGAQLTMSAQQLARGSGKRSTIFKKFFNGDMFASFPNEAGLLDLYLDGNGATYTGRLLPINGTDARQYAHRCVIKDAESYCIEFAVAAGSQCTFNDCEISRYDGLTAGKFSVKISDTQQLSAVPRKFTNIETNGTLFIDFGGCNNTYADGCFAGGYKYTADTRAANITGGRIANQLTLALDGHNNSLVAVDVTPLISIQSGADNNHLGNNSYNNGVPVDSSGNNRNTITHIETPYTPVFTAGGAAFVLGNGTLTGSQSRTGSKITFTANLTIGGTTTVGTGAYSISLPVASNNTLVQEIGVVHIDRGGTHYSGFMQIAGGANVTTAQPIRDTSGSITFNSPGVLAAGDTIRMSGTYQL